MSGTVTKERAASLTGCATRRPLLPWITGGALILLAVLSRAPSFVMSVTDWDESLYVIMAGQWRAGHLPYTAVWDNKPIGIYAIFALFQSVFGDRILLHPPGGADRDHGQRDPGLAHRAPPFARPARGCGRALRGCCGRVLHPHHPPG